MKKILIALLTVTQIGYSQSAAPGHADRNFEPAANDHVVAETADDDSADQVTTMAKASVAASPQRQVWVAVRKDGVAGDGSKTNPFDGSTEEKFDAVLEWLMSTASNSVQTVLVMGPGVYTVTPVEQVSTTTNPAGYTSNIPGNLQIIGAGETKTIIRAGIVPDDNATYWVLMQCGNIGGLTVSNLTVDCNIQNQTASHITIDGLQFINFYGNAAQSLFKFVHLINGGNREGDPGCMEWFGLAMCDTMAGSFSQITHCRIDQYQGTSACTALVGGASATYNVVTLNASDPYNFTGSGGTGGYQNGYAPCPEFHNNVASKCTTGIYTDIESPHDLEIFNNKFDCLYAGVVMVNGDPNATITNVSIHNNTMGRTYYPPIIIGTEASLPVNSQISVTNNRFAIESGAYAPGSPVFGFTAVKQAVVANNVLTLVNTGASAPQGGGNFVNCELNTIKWYNNKLKSGAVAAAPSGTTATN